MHGEVAADAVAGAVVEIETALPERRAGQRVELGAGGPLGKPRRCERDMSLQYAREAGALAVRRGPDSDRAGDVRRAVEELRAGIHQVEHVRRERPVGGLGHAVMDDRAVGPRAGDGREAEVAEERQLLAAAAQAGGGGKLRLPPGRALAVEPGEEVRHRAGVAAVRGPRAGNLAPVLAGLGQDAGVALPHELRARRLQPRDHPGRRTGGIDLHRLAGKRVERRPESLRRRERHLIAEMPAEARRRLCRIDEQLRLPFAVQQREAERQRRVGDIAAAHIEQPGDGVRQGQHGGVAACPVERSGNLAALVDRLAAGISEVVGDHRRARRSGPVGPDRIQRILRTGDQAAARLAGGFLELPDFPFHMQPGVVSERTARRQVRRDPFRRRVVAYVEALEDLGIDLVRHLQRVAAVAEHRALFEHQHGDTGGTGESGQPGQPRRARRHIFPLVLVRARHHEAVEAPPAQFSAERVHSLPTAAHAAWLPVMNGQSASAPSAAIRRPSRTDQTRSLPNSSRQHQSRLVR